MDLEKSTNQLLRKVEQNLNQYFILLRKVEQKQVF